MWNHYDWKIVREKIYYIIHIVLTSQQGALMQIVKKYEWKAN